MVKNLYKNTRKPPSGPEVKEVDGDLRVALVIGNSLYSGALPKLTNPIRDARDMRDVLKNRALRLYMVKI